ncbi:MAG: PepSY domain-containing protein [Caulobacterales bacterium]
MKPIRPLVGAALASLIVIGGAFADPPTHRRELPQGGPPSAPPPHEVRRPAGPVPRGPRETGAGPDSLGADWRQQQDEARDAVRQRRLMSLGLVIVAIRRHTPGHQLDAGLEYQGERAVYRVRWMTDDGRRIDYLVDAATGAILSGG